MDDKPKVVYKTKKSTGKTIAIIFLSICLILSIIYIVCSEYKNTKKEEHKEVNKREELYYSEVEKMMNQIDMYNYIFGSIYPIDDIKNIDNQLKLKFGIYALEEVEKIYNYYKVEDIKEIYKNYFVDGFSAVYEDIECQNKDNPLYKYNSETKIYTEIDDHPHGFTTLDIDTYYVNGKIDDDKYIINTNILYSNYCSDTCNPNGGYYKSYSDAEKGETPVFYRKNDYKKSKDELPITTYTFIKEKENYKLESIEIKN